LQLAEAAEVRVDLLLRLVTDRAGIEEDDVRLPLVLHAAVPAQLEAAGEPLAVEIVHLTAPRFDEEGLHCLFAARAASTSSFFASNFLRITSSRNAGSFSS